MKVYKLINHNLIKESTIYSALDIDLNSKQIISFVGGGGKTTSIYSLGKELSTLGKKVIIITTTHMQTPKNWIAYNDNIDLIKSKLKSESLIVVGTEGKSGKISAVNEKVAYDLYEICDCLLVEADGAKMLPLKAPESHEPVILRNTTMIVGVAGIDSLNKTINTICHRPHKVCELLKTDLQHKITIQDISEILSSPRGQAKLVDEFNNIEYRCIINKADNLSLVYKAKNVLEYLSCKNIKGIITSYRDE